MVLTACVATVCVVVQRRAGAMDVLSYMRLLLGAQRNVR